VQDYLSQLGESRMTGARLESKISNSAERVKSMQHMYALERISKQKNLMKFIREQLRLSDFRRVIDKVSKAGRDSLDEIEMQRKELLAASQPSVNQSLPDNNRIRALMVQLMQVAEQLSATALFNGQDDSATNNDDVPVGSLELRVPDSQVDDETLHGVVGLLCGALGPSGGHDDTAAAAVHPSDGLGRTDAFRQSDLAMGEGLGVDLTGARLSAATQIAKTFMTVQSNYADRILLLNLKDNLLSDISCKILSGLVEKTKSLRMLDLRGNMISPVGAKMLFDATRRNQSILYVTQRQHGFMVEGHREIMGSVQQRENKNSFDERKHHEEDEDDEEEGGRGDEQYQSAKNTVRNMKKKQPLRIDMRNNNPEQEAIEKLLESNEYTSRTGMREKYHNDLEQHDSSRHRPNTSSQHDAIRRRNDTQQQQQHSAQKRRPNSAAGSGSGGRIGGAGLARSYGNSDSQGLVRDATNTYQSSEHSRSQRPLTSSQQMETKVKSWGSGQQQQQQLLPQVGDSDEEVLNTVEEKVPPDPTKMTELQKRLAAKENERIIGIRTRDGGAGVGSLLDKEIRSMQEQGAEAAKQQQLLRKSASRVSGRGSSSSKRQVRPKSASSSGRNSRSRPASASASGSGGRRAQTSSSAGRRANGGGGGGTLHKSSSDGSVLRRRARTPQKGMSATADLLSATKHGSGGGNSNGNNNNSGGNNAYFHLNPAVLF
jgi:hypothetical protein